MRTGRILLAVALVVVLIAIAYVKSLYSSQEKEAVGARHLAERDSILSVNTVAVGARISDSLQHLFHDSLQAVLAGTGRSREAQQVCVDSLEKALGQSSALITKLRQAEGATLRRWVQAFYAGEIALLPADLSDYERNVSIKEIKNKIRTYFGLTPAELDQLLKKNR